MNLTENSNQIPKIASVGRFLRVSFPQFEHDIKDTFDGGLMTKRIYIKYHDSEIEHCKKIKVGDWVDLRAAERISLPFLGYAEISLGFAMRLPRGYEAHVLPRSSTFKKWGIIQANSQGVIDNSYSGDGDIWKFPAIALRKTVIEKGDRICQFRIMRKQPVLRFIERLFLSGKNRGGFGSTGKR